MSEHLEYGTVKYFGHRDKFGFVFVTDEDGVHTGEELFFHMNGAHPPEWFPWDDAPHFARWDARDAEGNPIVTAEPPLGTEIVFQRKTHPRGATCEPWAWRTAWKAAQASIDNLPALRLVRLHEAEVADVIWTGPDSASGRDHVRELSIRYPMPYPYGSDFIGRTYASGTEVNEITDGVVIQGWIREENEDAWMNVYDLRAPLDMIPRNRWSFDIPIGAG